MNKGVFIIRKKIENIRIHAFSANPNINTYGANNQFKNQRLSNPEYDQFLRELSEYLKDELDDTLKHIYNVLIYKGNVTDIIRDIIPKINLLYNDGLSAYVIFKKIKKEGIK